MNLRKSPRLRGLAVAFLCLVFATSLIGQCVIPGATTIVVSSGWSPLAADTGKIYWANCSTACTVTVPTTPPTAVWRIKVQVVGAGSVSVSAGGTTVNDPAGATSYPTNSVFEISTDGTSNYYVTRLAVPVFFVSGTAALGTSAITSGSCATVVTVSASGVVTTDVVVPGFNGDPTGVTGYAPSSSGMLTIYPYPTANNVNFKVCNSTASSITPGSLTLNWKVGPR